MNAGTTTLITASALTIAALPFTQAQDAQPQPVLPPIVKPHPLQNTVPPADAIILFDGKNADQWQSTRAGNPIAWDVDHEKATLTIKPGSGSIVTRESFAAAQIHLEFATPADAAREGQGRGNSGIYIQSRYEIQILDSFENETYPDGQCGSVYGQYPPLVNASRAPGTWQTYDIIFHPPTFDEQKSKTAAGTITVFHNGILIQDHVQLQGPTMAAPHGDETGIGPIYLQDHGNAVSYRNIWLRPL